MRHQYQNFSLTYSFLPERIIYNEDGPNLEGKETPSSKDAPKLAKDGEKVSEKEAKKEDPKKEEVKPAPEKAEAKPEKVEKKEKEIDQKNQKKLEKAKRRIAQHPFNGEDLLDPKEKKEGMKPNELKELEKKQYKEAIRAHIETGANADAWYKYCESHMTYNSDFRQWNTDLCEKVLGKTGLAPKIQRKYAAGLQFYLSDKLASSMAFEMKEGKRINRFTYTDGMIGGYTISALRAFLTSDKSGITKKPEWKMEYVALGEKIKKPSRRTEFDNAIKYLKGQTEKKEVVAANAAPPAPTGALAPILGAAPTPAQQPTVAPTPASVIPGAPAQQPAVAAPALAKAPDSVARKIEMPSNSKSRAEDLRKKIFHNLDFPGYPSAMGGFEKLFNKKLHDKQIKNLDYLRDEASKNPHAIGYINNLDDIEGSWPDLAFRDFVKIYDNVKAKGDDPSSDPNVTDSFDRMRQAVTDYQNKVDEIASRMRSEYGEKADRIIIDYDLPEDFDVIKNSPRLIGEFGAETSSYREQRKKIRPEGLQDIGKINQFCNTYFRFPPKKKFANWDALQPFLRKPTDQLQKFFSGLDTNEIVARVNNIILYQNMFHVYDESNKLRDEFDKKLVGAIGQLNSEYQNYYQSIKGKPTEPQFISAILEKVSKSLA